MEKVSSKDRILDSALDLFSEKGYDGVGVDQIAQNIGLKGPSIYKHFKGKEDILKCLMDRLETHYQKNFGSVENIGEVPSSMEALIASSMKRIEFTMHDPQIRKVRRFLSMEQFRNPMMAEITTMHSLTGIQNMYSKIFAVMIAQNLVKAEDSDVLALEWVSPVALMVQICDRQPEKETQCMKTIQEHFEHFAKTYAL